VQVVWEFLGDGYTSELAYRSVETCILEFSPLQNGLSQNCRTAGQNLPDKDNPLS